MNDNNLLDVRGRVVQRTGANQNEKTQERVRDSVHVFREVEPMIDMGSAGVICALACIHNKTYSTSENNPRRPDAMLLLLLLYTTL